MSKEDMDYIDIGSSVKMNHKGVRITFKDGKKSWYGEFTKEDYIKGLGWNQWGASSEKLCESMPAMEYYTKLWIQEFGK